MKRFAIALVTLAACGKSPEQGSAPAPKENEEIVFVSVTDVR